MVNTDISNKEVIRRHYELYDQGQLDDDFNLFWSEEVKVHGFTPEPLDREAFKQMLVMFSGAFSESKHRLELMIEEGDIVATYWKWQGIHSSAFMDLPATGKQVSIHGITMDRIIKGKIQERWGVFDQMGLMQQLGMIPAQS